MQKTILHTQSDVIQGHTVAPHIMINVRYGSHSSSQTALGNCINFSILFLIGGRSPVTIHDQLMSTTRSNLSLLQFVNDRCSSADNVLRQGTQRMMALDVWSRGDCCCSIRILSQSFSSSNRIIRPVPLPVRRINPKESRPAKIVLTFLVQVGGVYR